MPLSDIKQVRKRLLPKYLAGFLSEKSKAKFGFPLGDIQRDFDPFSDQDSDPDFELEGE
jgi:hypothetical protein